MKCCKCGSENAKDATFCEKCGQNLQQVAIGTGTDSNSATTISQTPQIKKTTLPQKKMLVIGCVIAAIIATAVIGGMFFTKQYSKKLERQGEEYLAAKDLVKAAEVFAKAAKFGNTDAMNNLAQLYADGIGVQKDIEKAAKLFHKASKKGNTEATNNLGLLYYYNGGDIESCRKAMDIWHKLAIKGNKRAIYLLGNAYAQGGNHQALVDNKLALEWLKKAADAGNARAMYDISVIYSNGGYGIQADETQGMVWLQKAAAAGDDLAKQCLALRAEAAKRRNGYSDNELCQMADAYWHKHNGNAGNPVIEIDSSDGNEVTIHIYENHSDHVATLDWYYVNRNGKGHNFMEEPIDLAE